MSLSFTGESGTVPQCSARNQLIKVSRNFHLELTVNPAFEHRIRINGREWENANDLMGISGLLE